MNSSTLLGVCVVLVMAAGCGPRPSSTVPDNVFGHCDYTNRFSNLPECREFRGDGWTEATAQASCDEYKVPFTTGACPTTGSLGACVTSSDPHTAQQLVIPGTDANKCSSSQRGCELFGGGTWVNGDTCGDTSAVDVDGFYDPTAPFSVPAVQDCRDPLPGEPPGQSADGKVCTWVQMSGCTEEGRKYEDYASCDDVRTQRPYSPVPADTTQPLNDPRLQDPTYAAEVSWVKTQLESCACNCCHKASVTPRGASIWDTDVDGNFVNTFSDWGIGFAARAFDSSLLGTYEATDNNGFSRHVAGLPSTDEARMKRFFENEIEHRGLTVADFANEPPAPSVFFSQSTYVPTACTQGEGVDDAGVLHWKGGRARYVYVLEAGTVNPGVPPNLDTPDGTLWRIDTVPPAIPMKTGEVHFGDVVTGTHQTFPVAGAPAALVKGTSYYIYTQADIGVPVTRCLFTF